MQVQIAAQVRQQSQQQRAESHEMAASLEEWRSSREGAQWQQDRARLPVLTIRQDLLAQLAEHDVVVVSGDTGCGKTTQVNPYPATPGPCMVYMHYLASQGKHGWVSLQKCLSLPQCLHDYADCARMASAHTPCCLLLVGQKWCCIHAVDAMASICQSQLFTPGRVSTRSLSDKSI